MNGTAQTVSVCGWNHSGCGPWVMTRRVPKRWRRVTRGKARATDRCLMATDAGVRVAQHSPSRNRHHDTYIPSKWEAVRAENVGVMVNEFRAIIRKV